MVEWRSNGLVIIGMTFRMSAAMDLTGTATGETRPGVVRGEKVPITVLVPTLNEERNLADCLRHLEWADEVVVVDSSSTDATREIAEKHGRGWWILCGMGSGLRRRTGRWRTCRRGMSGF